MRTAPSKSWLRGLAEAPPPFPNPTYVASPLVSPSKFVRLAVVAAGSVPPPAPLCRVSGSHDVSGVESRSRRERALS